MSENAIKTLKKDEGFLPKATNIMTRKGTKEKNKTIGYGYNLSAHPNPTGDLIEAGVDEEDVPAVMRGEKEISEEQGSLLLVIASRRAKRDAMKLIPNFNDLPSQAQDTMINMSYQLGYSRLRGFSKLREALYQQDFDKAAQEILDSDMARVDSPDRSERHARALKQVAQQKRDPANKNKDHPVKDKIRAARRELLMQKAAKLKRNQGGDRDPRMDSLVGAFDRMMKATPPPTPTTETTTTNEEVTNGTP